VCTRRVRQSSRPRLRWRIYPTLADFARGSAEQPSVRRAALGSSRRTCSRSCGSRSGCHAGSPRGADPCCGGELGCRPSASATRKCRAGRGSDGWSSHRPCRATPRREIRSCAYYRQRSPRTSPSRPRGSQWDGRTAVHVTIESSPATRKGPIPQQAVPIRPAASGGVTRPDRATVAEDCRRATAACRGRVAEVSTYTPVHTSHEERSSRWVLKHPRSFCQSWAALPWRGNDCRVTARSVRWTRPTIPRGAPPSRKTVDGPTLGVDRSWRSRGIGQLGNT
jgi:hypothetical protein